MDNSKKKIDRQSRYWNPAIRWKSGMAG